MLVVEDGFRLPALQKLSRGTGAGKGLEGGDHSWALRTGLVTLVQGRGLRRSGPLWAQKGTEFPCILGLAWAGQFQPVSSVLCCCCGVSCVADLPLVSISLFLFALTKLIMCLRAIPGVSNACTHWHSANSGLLFLPYKRKAWISLASFCCGIVPGCVSSSSSLFRSIFMDCGTSSLHPYALRS